MSRTDWWRVALLVVVVGGLLTYCNGGESSAAHCARDPLYGTCNQPVKP